MTIQVCEDFDSRRFYEENRQPRAVRRFKVFDDDADVVVTGPQTILAPGIPRHRDPHPDQPNLRAISIPTVDPVRDGDRQYTFHVTIRYHPIPMFGGIGDRPEPGEEGFVSINATVEAPFVDVYRMLDLRLAQNWSYFPVATPDVPPTPNPGDKSYPSAKDMGGISVDSVGDPVSYSVAQVRVDVTNIVRRYPFPKMNQFNFFANTRNKTPFLGAEAERLLYTGVEVFDLQDNLFELVHHFVYDNFWHLRQVARIDPNDGRPFHWPDPNQTGVTPQPEVARYVNWIQPYPDRRDFHALPINTR